jgi:hypothetical protein
VTWGFPFPWVTILSSLRPMGEEKIMSSGGFLTERCTFRSAQQRKSNGGRFREMESSRKRIMDKKELLG